MCYLNYNIQLSASQIIRPCASWKSTKINILTFFEPKNLQISEKLIGDNLHIEE